MPIALKFSEENFRWWAIFAGKVTTNPAMMSWVEKWKVSCTEHASINITINNPSHVRILFRLRFLYKHPPDHLQLTTSLILSRRMTITSSSSSKNTSWRQSQSFASWSDVLGSEEVLDFKVLMVSSILLSHQFRIDKSAGLLCKRFQALLIFTRRKILLAACTTSCINRCTTSKDSFFLSFVSESDQFYYLPVSKLINLRHCSICSTYK